MSSAKVLQDRNMPRMNYLPLEAAAMNILHTAEINYATIQGKWKILSLYL